MILVSIRDSKAETWTPPHPTTNKAVALREFGCLVNDNSQTLVSQHPADFDLFQVASLDDPFTGKVEGNVPEHIANGLDMVISK